MELDSKHTEKKMFYLQLNFNVQNHPLSFRLQNKDVYIHSRQTWNLVQENCGISKLIEKLTALSIGLRVSVFESLPTCGKLINISEIEEKNQLRTATIN